MREDGGGGAPKSDIVSRPDIEFVKIDTFASDFMSASLRNRELHCSGEGVSIRRNQIFKLVASQQSYNKGAFKVGRSLGFFGLFFFYYQQMENHLK